MKAEEWQVCKRRVHIVHIVRKVRKARGNFEFRISNFEKGAGKGDNFEFRILKGEPTYAKAPARRSGEGKRFRMKEKEL